MKPAALAALLLMVFVCAFGSGWAVNGWRLGEQIKATAEAAEKQRADAVRWAMTEQDRAAQAMRQQDTEAQQRIAEKNEQLSAFERCIADGRGCGLRVKVARCPASLPEAGAAASVGGGSQQGAELADSVGPDYRALRTGIVRLEQALKVCVNAAERSQ